jgi:uncharacterized membrane protein
MFGIFSVIICHVKQHVLSCIVPKLDRDIISCQTQHYLNWRNIFVIIFDAA